MKTYYDKDTNADLIKNKKVAIFWLWKSGSCTRFKFKR